MATYKDSKKGERGERRGERGRGERGEKEIPGEWYQVQTCVYKYKSIPFPCRG